MSFYSGSTYTGQKEKDWFHGEGTFTYPSGVKYKGNFHKGQFHGEGTLIYQNGGYFKGVWNMGKLTSGDYFYFDNLKFEEKEWDYCVNDDRRFNYERANNIKPSGQTQIINDPAGEKAIPPCTYDTGNGFFDPIRGVIFSYDSKTIMKTPTAEEVDWITRKCRYNPRATPDLITGANDQVIMRILEIQDENRPVQEKQSLRGENTVPSHYQSEQLPEAAEKEVEAKIEQPVEVKEEPKPIDQAQIFPKEPSEQGEQLLNPDDIEN